jgi:hypothetical protein
MREGVVRAAAQGGLAGRGGRWRRGEVEDAGVIGGAVKRRRPRVLRVSRHFVGKNMEKKKKKEKKEKRWEKVRKKRGLFILISSRLCIFYGLKKILFFI